MPTGGRWYRWRSRGEAVTVVGASSKPVLRDERGRFRPTPMPAPIVESVKGPLLQAGYGPRIQLEDLLHHSADKGVYDANLVTVSED